MTSIAWENSWVSPRNLKLVNMSCHSLTQKKTEITFDYPENNRIGLMHKSLCCKLKKKMTKSFITCLLIQGSLVKKHCRYTSKVKKYGASGTSNRTLKNPWQGLQDSILDSLGPSFNYSEDIVKCFLLTIII